MGTSAPPTAAVDLVDSHARLVRQHVEIVLAEPSFELAPEAAVVLRRGKRRRAAEVEVVTDEHGRRLVARLPRAKLADGVWNLRIRTEEGSTPLGCRLLVQGERPVVLLWGGRAPRSRLPEAHRIESVEGRGGSRRRRVARAAARARSVAGRIRRSLRRRVRRSA